MHRGSSVSLRSADIRKVEVEETVLKEDEDEDEGFGSSEELELIGFIFASC